MKKGIMLSILLGSLVYGQIHMSEAQIHKMGIGVQNVRMIKAESVGPFIGMFDYADKGSKSYTLSADATVVELIRYEGDRVRAGEAVCKIASAELLQSSYELKEVKNRYKIAKEYAKKDANLFQSGVISAREAQKSELEAMSLKVKIEELEQRFVYAGTDSRSQEGMIFTIKARQNGILAKAPMKTGEKIEPFTPYLKIVKADSLNAYIKIPPKMIASIRKGAPVMNNHGDKIGQIVSISASVDMMSNSATATAAIEVRDDAYRSGTSSEFYIGSTEKEPWVLLPKSSVTKYKKKDICFVQTKEGFESKNVEIQKIYKDHIAVKADGFTPKTMVVKEGIIILKGSLSGMGFE